MKVRNFVAIPQIKCKSGYHKILNTQVKVQTQDWKWDVPKLDRRCFQTLLESWDQCKQLQGGGPTIRGPWTSIHSESNHECHIRGTGHPLSPTPLPGANSPVPADVGSGIGVGKWHMSLLGSLSHICNILSCASTMAC